jgi:hypothetical protein
MSSLFIIEAVVEMIFALDPENETDRQTDRQRECLIDPNYLL